jgi:hypothetical protein
MKILTETIATVKKNLSVILVVNLMVGLLNLSLYYKFFFDFDIIPYLDISEILLLSSFSIGHLNISDVATFSITTLLLLWWGRTTSESKESVVGRTLFSFLVVVVVIKGPMLFCYIWLVKTGFLAYDFSIFFTVMLAVLAFLYGILWFIHKHDTITLPIGKTAVLYVLTVIYSNIFYYSLKDGADALFISSPQSSSIKTSSYDTLKDKSLKRIGRSKGYVYFYDTVKKSTLVIPTIEIKEERVKSVFNNNIFGIDVPNI